MKLADPLLINKLSDEVAREIPSIFFLSVEWIKGVDISLEPSGLPCYTEGLCLDLELRNAFIVDMRNCIAETSQLKSASSVHTSRNKPVIIL